MDTHPPLNDRYQLSAHVARGGMADVYKGQDTLLGRRVAIKVLHAQFSTDEAFVKRFRREAQAAANLSHPNVVGIYDWGQADSTYYIVMELVDGRSLREVLRSEGALLPRRATEIAAEVAAALAVAHRHGLIHRDIKPGNILLAADGTVKVTDFGIARAWDDSQELTRTGAVIGTATYFSPEQAQGAPADERSDIYSLGVVLYEMLSGRPPFQGDSPVAVAYQHVSAEALPPSSNNPDVPAALDAIVIKAMHKNPDLRYQSADEMRADLLRALRGEQPQIAAPPPPMVTDEHSATRVMSQTQVPPPSVPPDEVYRQLEERSPSQIPMILTAFGVLALVAALVFFVFQLANSRAPANQEAEIPNVEGQLWTEAHNRLTAAGFVALLQTEPSDEVAAQMVIRTEPAAGEIRNKGSSVIIYASAGEETFPIPTLIGQTLENARSLIEQSGFAEGTINSRPDSERAQGTVLEQDPAAGLELARGTLIDLVVSSGPEIFEMPDLVRQTEGDAFTALSGLGLRWTRETEASNDVPRGQVVRTEPAAGQQVMAGDTVVVVISTGLLPVTVPNISSPCTTVEGATTILQDAGLTINVQAARVATNDPACDGRVLVQNPAPGAQLDVGSAVSVNLGLFNPPDTTPAP